MLEAMLFGHHPACVRLQPLCFKNDIRATGCHKINESSRGEPYFVEEQNEKIRSTKIQLVQDRR